MASKVTNDEKAIIFNPGALSILQGIFSSPADEGCKPAIEGGATTASVKFMITRQDEKDLHDLGYSPERIAKMKPQEATEIIRSGVKAAQDEP